MSSHLTDASTRSGYSPDSQLSVPGTPRNGSDGLLHRIKNVPGYTTPVFKGKEEQRALVQQEVAAKVCLDNISTINELFFNLILLGFHPSRARRQ